MAPWSPRSRTDAARKAACCAETTVRGRVTAPDRGFGARRRDSGGLLRPVEARAAAASPHRTTMLRRLMSPSRAQVPGPSRAQVPGPSRAQVPGPSRARAPERAQVRGRALARQGGRAQAPEPAPEQFGALPWEEPVDP